jgi:hypothetical protein
MNVKELRIQLELKGLDTKGLKADLLKRLKEYCSNLRKKRLSYQLNDESDEEECPDDCLCGIQKMDVEEIKSQLRTDGVSINGSKDELVQRLINHLKKKFQNEEDDDDDDEEMESASDTEQIEINIYKKNSADATYKLLQHGYPLLVVGTTDKARKFHPFGIALCSNEKSEAFSFIFKSIKECILTVYNYDYEPNVLVADARDVLIVIF